MLVVRRTGPASAARPIHGSTDGSGAGRRALRWSTAGLPVLALASLAVMASQFGSWYWIDEALTVGIARGGLVQIPDLLRADGSPPLYYLLLAVWTSLFGVGEIATHLLSVLFALVSIPVGFLASRRLFGERAAWVTATLFAFSPFLTHFSRETRMYTIVVLLGLVVATTFVGGFVFEDRRSAMAFPVALAALVYTHNWGLYTAAAAGLALIPAAVAGDDAGRMIKRGIASLAAVGFAYVPWALVLLGQIGDTGAPWAYTPRVREVVWEVAALVRDERVLLLLTVIAGGSLLSIFRKPRTQQGAMAWALATFCVVPVVLGWLVSHVEPSWATRYLAVVVGPMLLLAGWGLSRVGTVGVLALVISVGLWVQPLARLDGGVSIERHAKSDGKEVARQVDEQLQPDDLVIVAQPEAVPLFALYMQDDVRFATLYGGVLENPMVMDWRGASEKLQKAEPGRDLLPLLRDLEPGQRVALVGPGGRLVRTDTDWIRTFHRKHSIWLDVLRAGNSYERVARINPDLETAVPFVATVFQNRTRTT